MIVNPQLFNYRLITGSLIVVIAAVTVYSFTNQQSIEAHQQFLEQEKKLVENELSQMIQRYDDVSSTNSLIAFQLKNAKLDAKNALDSLRLLRSDVAVISKVKQRVSVLQSKNYSLFHTIDSLKDVTLQLEQEKLLAYNQLNKERFENKNLAEKHKALLKSIEEASLLKANAFSAKAYNGVSEKAIETYKASKAKSIEVCFTIAENSLAPRGEKDIYIQVLNPLNNVFADKGAINFGDSSLIYSLKKVVSYQNQVIDVCLTINADEDDQPLIEGTYFINVFNKDRKLGSTQLQLN
ncbi:hypothetical protein OE09_0234 [Flavobacteriaceae bacterium MAR_2010_72]|nr:hypothetical protein OE09_0234 [Flavobacteriaceae bacterium MAR_2010_72]TVZ58065.1 hypothetical protein NA63_0558 [Flavobacteriaceae bacterium MAR_2010_105]